jgi:penicillin-binding protein 1B
MVTKAAPPKKASVGKGTATIRKKPLWRRLINPWSLTVVTVLLTLWLAAFGYFYYEASSSLDQWLQGSARTVRPSNIYAAPLGIQVGQAITPKRIIEHLSRASYAESGKSEDRERGVYREEGRVLEIRPGSSSVIDGRRFFPPVRVTFDEKMSRIVSILDLDSDQPRDRCQLEPGLITTVTRQLGQPMSNVERGIRYEVGYEQIPPQLVNAVIATEDKSFFEHTGVNYLSILRALWVSLWRNAPVRGTSTITQQLVKNILVGSERSYQRKFREAFLALALERRFGKKEIFTQYANVIYLGRRASLNIYGLGAAAREYFGKDISDLSLSESAMLAGMINRPAYYTQVGRGEEATTRRNYVLSQMLEMQMITSIEAEQAKREPLKLQLQSRPGTDDLQAPYFIDYVQQALTRFLPNEDLAAAGYRVYSTLDLDLQRAASIAVGEGLAVLDRSFRRRKPPIAPGTVQGALVALDIKSGDILAMVGGRSYAESQFNRATEARRQPGSAIKPLVYSAALSEALHDEQPVTLATLYIDEPQQFEAGYSPENFGGEYLQRAVSVREALTRSLNVITVKLAQETGYSRVAGRIGEFGIPRPPANASIALGTGEVTPLELASAYTVFATGGRRVIPSCLRQIADSNGHVVRQVPAQQDEVLAPPLAYLVLSVLRDVIAQPFGTGHKAAELGTYALAGKTGTSQRSDAWFVGFTPNLVCAAWVGFDDNRQLYLTGSQAALPIWLSFMRQVARLRPELLEGEFLRPESLIDAPIDPTTGLRATQMCPEYRVELFLEDREITDLCTAHPGPALELPEPGSESTGEQPPAKPPEPKPQTRALRATEKPKQAQAGDGRQRVP